jgi:hypothetical protein
VYLHLVIFYYLAQDWSYPELHARTGATPEQVYLHLVRLHYLTQDWSYPRTECPNWSYPSAGFACALVWLLGSVFGLRSSVLIGPWDPWTHGPLDHWTLGPVDPLDPKPLDPKSLDPPACSELGLTPSAFAMDASVDGKYSTPAEPNVGGVLCLINSAPSEFFYRCVLYL